MTKLRIIEELVQQLADIDKSTPPPERLTKALKVIEAVAGENQTLPKNLNTEREKQLHGAVGQIYRVAHAAREPDCMSSHQNWEREFQWLTDVFDA